MAIPQSREARRYYFAAKQRFEAARILSAAAQTTSEVYLGGYCVACMLKALILSAAPVGKQDEILDSFKGGWAHDYEKLKAIYLKGGGASWPPDVAKNFTLVDTWSTDLRYKPGLIDPEEAQIFLDAAEAIMVWADGRI